MERMQEGAFTSKEYDSTIKGVGLRGGPPVT